MTEMGREAVVECNFHSSESPVQIGDTRTMIQRAAWRPSVTFAFFSEEVSGIEGLGDRTFDDVLERSDDCGCVDAPSIGKAVLAIVGHDPD